MAMNDIVSNAEKRLIAIACRLDTALHYQDEHGADDDWIRQGIEDEMIGINEIFEAAGNTVPRLHALLRMIGERSERAQELKDTMNLDDFSTDEIKKFCAFVAKENPQWHPLLTMPNVQALASQLPPVVEWWLPGERTIEDKEEAEDAAAEADAREEDRDSDNDDEIQIVDSLDTAGSVQPWRSGHHTKGKAPARADDNSGTVDASDGSNDIEMGEVIDNQKTPKTFQPVKRAIVISPASEVPAKRQQRRTSAAAKAAAKAIGRLPDPACQLCKIRKVLCNPPPKWAIAQIKAKQQAAKAKQETKTRKRSATTIMEDLPPTLDGLKTRLDSMETNFTAFQEAMDMHMGALQDVIHNINLMMITPSTFTLQIPPVPLFEQAAPPPSPTPGPSSIASTISSTSSTGFNVSQLSIAAPLPLWPWAVVPDRLIPLRLCLTLRAMGTRGLPSSLHPEPQAPLGLGRRLAHATEGKGP
ncbi:hypothetical protein EDB89DRAFT_1904499 [Lactarius sanguifluus]|nr:hypothetical protein EDB89DRAFT_1904499 [Lactarius sanguifluus]